MKPGHASKLLMEDKIHGPTLLKLNLLHLKGSQRRWYWVEEPSEKQILKSHVLQCPPWSQAHISHCPKSRSEYWHGWENHVAEYFSGKYILCYLLLGGFHDSLPQSPLHLHFTLFCLLYHFSLSNTQGTETPAFIFWSANWSSLLKFFFF